MSVLFDAASRPGVETRSEVGDLMVAYLAQLGVEFVFGIPGGAIEPLYNALARSARRGGPRPIVARHETGAAFMADGYFHHTGKLGVVCATTGPGATNLITGVCSAYQNYVPLLVITAQTAMSSFGRGAFQESSCTGIDVLGLFNSCTKYNTFVSHIDQFEYKLVSALRHALSLPNGPVHLSVPLDLLRQVSPTYEPSFDVSRLLGGAATVDRHAFERLRQYISLAQKPIFVIGGNCTGAIDSILDVAVLLQAPIVTTPHGKGLVNAYHPLYRGTVGFAGHQDAVTTLTDSAVDMVLAIGTNLGEWATDGWNPELLLNDRLVHVSDSENDLTLSPMARLQVLGNLDTVFKRLAESLRSTMSEHTVVAVNKKIDQLLSEDPRLHFQLDEPEKFKATSTPIKPQQLMRELADQFPINTRFLADTGNSMAWATHYLHPYDRRMSGGRTCQGANVRTSMEFASMGWAVGAAVGAALACPGIPIVCITGDGSILMSGQEITVAIQEKLPVIYVILNDAALGMVKHGQRLAQAESVGYELPEVDFAGVAHAMGVPGYVINSPIDFHRIDIEAICKRRGPTVLDVRIDTEEVPPMGSRMRVLRGK